MTSFAVISAVVTILVACVPATPRGSAGGENGDRAVVPFVRSDQAVELAPLMGELQRLTHKLSLSIAEANYQLGSFYVYESLESIAEIQRLVPEYRGLPIALLIDQISLPRYEALKSALQMDAERTDSLEIVSAMREIIDGCNECHRATGHGFIKITSQTGTNPFLQDFSPEP